MSIWSRIAEALQALAHGEGLAAVFDRLRFAPERSVAFTIAVIALSAKMAKADGLVTRDEVTAMREVFHIADADEKAAARVFNLAREDVAGFEDYARRIAAMFDQDSEVLGDLMEGLFHIACADGVYHPTEDAFLARVSEIFGINSRSFENMRARYVPGAEPDPYTALGATPDMALADIRVLWRQLVRDNHPDRALGRGLPPEAIRLAETRMAAINRAWERIEAEHGA